MQWPNGKDFAFSVFDDTDDSTIQNTKPVYDLLFELGMLTTKSVWVLPSRGQYPGQTISDPAYLEWIRELQSKGFEIGLHNIGDGAFTREEILHGIELFHELLGVYPRIHTNHENNPDNIYWMEDRFDRVYRQFYRLYMRFMQGKPSKSLGSQPGSPYFWGDVCKQHIDYIRNHTCKDINTILFDPAMPYTEPRKSAYSNRWFSSSDGHTVAEFCDLLQPESAERLCVSRGACIVYTHFASGFVDSSGSVNPVVRQRLEHLASLGGYFAPVSTILDHLATQQHSGSRLLPPSTLKWLVDRILKKIRYGR